MDTLRHTYRTCDCLTIVWRYIQCRTAPSYLFMSPPRRRRQRPAPCLPDHYGALPPTISPLLDYCGGGGGSSSGGGARPPYNHRRQPPTLYTLMKSHCERAAAAAEEMDGDVDVPARNWICRMKCADAWNDNCVIRFESRRRGTRTTVWCVCVCTWRKATPILGRVKASRVPTVVKDRVLRRCPRPTRYDAQSRRSRIYWTTLHPLWFRSQITDHDILVQYLEFGNYTKH